ncbi:hypothetical protein J5N97_000879 [Dioscorea zingiberensis]|uniref:Uncharacterized protein n=1 Tax=Dioscorea zingiberensis TaxID=325984 RepID=A0A9D5BVY6_9LILI|nr:hypothetical protein J5N97_000879 [Dioscorea zingiberensis]
MDLDGVALSSDFRTFSGSLLALESLESLPLKSLNLTGTLACSSCGESRHGTLNLSGNCLKGPLADVLSFVASCSSLTFLVASELPRTRGRQDRTAVMSELQPVMVRS